MGVAKGCGHGAHSVGGDALEPVVVEVEEHHLRLCGLQDEVAQLLHLQPVT